MAVEPPSARSARASKQFRLALLAIALLALAIRICAAIWYDRNTLVHGDAFWYTTVGQHIAEGKGVIAPLGEMSFHRRIPSAAHPPAYAVYLSLISHFDTTTMTWRLWSTLPGVGTVLVLGVLGRELAGERAGLIAAALGALFVDLVAQDVILWSEGMFAFTIVLTVWLAYRYLRAPGLLRAALLGGAIALAALTRAEGVLLLVILLVPLAVRARAISPARRLACIAIGGLVALALFTPWFVYNANRFRRPVYLSTGLGALVGSSNCPGTYHGAGIGSWGGFCAQGVNFSIAQDESVQEHDMLHAGLRYARDHADRLPIVIPVRLFRSFGFYQPFSNTGRDLFLEGGNRDVAAWTAQIQYWILLPLGVAGLVVLARRRVSLLPFLAPIATVVVITVVGYGTTRFRIAFDAVLPALAAVALDAAWRRRQARRSPGPAPVGPAAHVSV